MNRTSAPRNPSPSPWRNALRTIIGSWTIALSALLLAGIGTEAVVFPAPAQAQLTGHGFSPQRFKDGVNYGNGIYFAPYDFYVYSQPNEASPLLAEFHWKHQASGNSVTTGSTGGERKSIAGDRVFISFYPQLDVAMMAVIGENGEDEKGDNWVEVVYDQAHQKTGWVHLKQSLAANPKPGATPGQQALASLKTDEPLHFGVYQTWPEFMKLNAKANGVYWLSGVKEYYRSIRSSDSDEAKLIPITIIRNLKVRHLRGNWLLVEVLDFENNTPIGWIRWRDDDGNLMVFPNINQQYHPVVTGNF
jgi:hypothetical protein